MRNEIIETIDKLSGQTSFLLNKTRHFLIHPHYYQLKVKMLLQFILYNN